MYGAPGFIALSADAGGIPAVPQELPKNLFRYGEQTMWSTQFHAASAALANGTFRLFTTPQSQSGQSFTLPLSIAETNLKEGGRVPNAVAFDVFGISCQVEHASAGTDVSGTYLNGAANTEIKVADLLNVQNNGILTWDFTQTQVDIAPIELIGAGGGAFGAISTTQDASQVGQLNNGAGAIWMYRKHPVALPGATTFAILLRYGSRAAPVGATYAICVRVVLLGYYKNVIEIGA